MYNAGQINMYENVKCFRPTFHNSQIFPAKESKLATRCRFIGGEIQVVSSDDSRDHRLILRISREAAFKSRYTSSGCPKREIIWRLKHMSS